MDVGRIPLDRKSQKCQRSHGEWIVLFLSGNVIYFLLSDQRCFFMLWECGGMTKMSVYVTVAFLNINCSGKLFLRYREYCLDIQLLFIQGHTLYLAGLTGPPYSNNFYTHAVTANTGCSHENAKMISIYRKAGHHPLVSNLALPKLWHLSLFIVCMLHPQFCLWSLPPIQHLLLSLPPSLISRLSPTH